MNETTKWAGVAPWSATGTAYRYGKTVTYQHIEVVPTEEMIVSCNACGRAAYAPDPATGSPVRTMPIASVRVSPNGYQTEVTHLCPECASELTRALFSFRK
jgi:hypothetical protein